MTIADTDSTRRAQLFENVRGGRATASGSSTSTTTRWPTKRSPTPSSTASTRRTSRTPSTSTRSTTARARCRRCTPIPSNDGISLGVYTFPPNFRLPRHWHDCDQIVFVLEGSMSTGNKQLRPGEGYYTRAGATYSFTAGPRGVRFMEFRPVTNFRTVFVEDNPTRWARTDLDAEPRRRRLSHSPRRGPTRDADARSDPSRRRPLRPTTRPGGPMDTAHDHRCASACSSRRTTRRRRTRPWRCSETSSSSSTSRTSASTRPGSASTTRPAGSTSARRRCSSPTRQRRRAGSSSARAWSRCRTTTRSWPLERMVLLDHLTRGRVIFGVGPGSLPTDAEMIGLEPRVLRPSWRRRSRRSWRSCRPTNRSR